LLQADSLTSSYWQRLIFARNLHCPMCAMRDSGLKPGVRDLDQISNLAIKDLDIP